MISVLMSEGLAPSNGVKSQEPPRDASRPSKDEKFSSFMESGDERSEVDPKQESDVGAAPGETATPEKTASTGDKAALTETSGTAADAALVDPKLTASETAETDAATAIKADIASADSRSRSNELPPQTEQTNADALRGADTTARSSEAEGEIVSRTGETDPRLAATSDTGLDPKIDDSGARTSSDTPEDVTLKFADTPGQSSGDGQSRPSPAPSDTLTSVDADAIVDADKVSADDLRTGELADLSARKQTDTQVNGDKLLQVNVAREAAPQTTESLLAVASTPAPSTAPPVSTGGLAPTVPTHVIAAPNELTSVVMNALKTGGDVQEQLVVQLDPPELGRILIDFKFDAQGLQQITVTSENPEALKRLRELHFELTEALKNQGFSDSNLSFQQEARDQSQSNWQAPEWARAQSQVVAAAARSESNSAMPTPPNFTGRDRLDLLL
ncbi:MAG: hypothetical protein Hens2KO_21750 [Henriciella sp.]